MKIIKKIGYLLSALLLLAFNIAVAQKIAITNVTVINVRDGVAEPAMTVIINGERIIAVGPGHTTEVPAGATVIDGSGKYLIPGLWDMHTHALWENLNLFNKLMIANGVTGFRDMWSNDSIACYFQRGIEDRVYLPQRFTYTNHMIDGDLPIWKGTISVSQQAEAVNVVDSLARTNTDFIKVYTGLSEESFHAIVERSKAQGLAVVGHIPASMKATDAIPHMKSIEHLYGMIEAHSPIHDSLLAVGKVGIEGQIMMLFNTSKLYEKNVNDLLVKHNTFLVPTFTLWKGYTRIASPFELKPDHRVKYIPKENRKTWTSINNQFVTKLNDEMFKVWLLKMDKHKDIIKNAHKAGVKILAGTDVAVSNPFTFPGFSLHDELENLVECGLSNLEALQTATLHAAKYLEKESEMGTIETGKVADLVLLDANPLEDITNTQKIHAVVANGRYLDRQALDKLLEEAEKAAK